MTQPASTDTSSANQSASNGQLFQQPMEPSASVGTVLLFLLTSVIVFGGFYLFGIAFDASSGTNAFLLFSGGLLAEVIGFWMAFGIIPNRR